jgi:hypothetical protein
LPTATSLKQFLIGTILPPLVGIAATWIVGTHVLALFPISKSQVVYEITQIATFGISAGFTWLTAHHILSGKWSAVAVAKNVAAKK